MKHVSLICVYVCYICREAVFKVCFNLITGVVNENVVHLEVYMCKWVSVIRYLLTIHYKFMFTINMYTLL